MTRIERLAIIGLSAVAGVVAWKVAWTYFDPWGSAQTGVTDLLIGLDGAFTFNGAFGLGVWLFPALMGAGIGWAIVRTMQHNAEFAAAQAERAAVKAHAEAVQPHPMD